ncbi:MAG: PEP-CTERM sorting domain-containing protein [Acidobacteria bacterium]|nr:PEP-CTERM sorting domain-containing protein [Acidobacteriota bacterium]
MRTLFLSVVLSALPAMAGLISNPTAGIFDGFTNAGVTGSFSGQPHAVISGTACYDGFCPGQAVPGAGPDYNVADPLTMKLTSFQAECAPSASACGGYVDAYFSFYATANAQYAASFSIDGQGSGNQSLLYGGFLLNQNTSVMLFGNQTMSLPPVNSTSFPAPLATINDSFSLGTINVNAGDQIYARISLGIDLVQGQTILLPDSLTLTLVDTSVPEPATLGLMAAAVAALVIGRKTARRM